MKGRREKGLGLAGLPGRIAPPRARLARAPLACALLACALLLAACGPGGDEPAVRVDLSRRQETAHPTAAAGITYAYLPQYSHTTSYRRHHRLVEYLARATGLPLRQVFPNTFDEHVEMVALGRLDISFANPFVSIRLARLGSASFARPVKQGGRTDFRSEIICRADNPEIRTTADCRGRRWIAVDPLSAGGFLFALGHFHDLGIRRSDFAEIAFAPGPGGKQENVVLAVLAGRYDFGTIREGTLDVLAGRIDRDQVRVLDRTRAYPEWLYTARKGLDPAVTERIGAAMFALDRADPEQAAILEAAGFEGIIPAQNSDFDAVRDLAAKLGLE